MARRKVIALEDEVLTPAELDDEESLDDFLATTGAASAQVEVFKVRPDGTDEQLERVVPDFLKDDPFSYLREKWGTGKYRLRFKDSQRKYRGHKVIQIGGTPQGNPTGQPVNGNHTNPADAISFRELMAMQQQWYTTLLTVMKPQPPPPGPDLGAMMQGLAAMLTAMVGGITKGAQDPTAIFKEMMGVVSPMLKDRPQEDPTEKFLKTVQVVKELMPENGAPDSFWGFAKDVGKEVVHRLAPPGGTPPMSLPAGPTASVPTEVSADPAKALAQAQAETQEPQKPNPLDFEQQIKIGLHYLKDKARRNKDVELFADMIVENYEEPQWNALLGAIERGATFDNLLQFDAEIGTDVRLRAWFGRLYSEIRNALQKPVDTGREGGNPPDPSGDEKPSVGGSPDPQSDPDREPRP